MTIKTRINVFLGVVVVFILAAIFGHFVGLEREAEFSLALLTAFSVGIAVIAAVYGNRLSEVVDPAQIELTMPSVTNTVFDKTEIEGNVQEVYCHHLQVVNRTKHKKLENCRVWLVAIHDHSSEDGWRHIYRFAVPRLMQWAPSEFEPKTRSFCDSQVFDFGMMCPAIREFRITYFKDQGGTFNGNCVFSKKRLYIFKVEADNLTTERRFEVEVEVLGCEPSVDWKYRCRARIAVRDGG